MVGLRRPARRRRPTPGAKRPKRPISIGQHPVRNKVSTNYEPSLRHKAHDPLPNCACAQVGECGRCLLESASQRLLQVENLRVQFDDAFDQVVYLVHQLQRRIGAVLGLLEPEALEVSLVDSMVLF